MENGCGSIDMRPTVFTGIKTYDKTLASQKNNDMRVFEIKPGTSSPPGGI
jgi:hypothetical protein